MYGNELYHHGRLNQQWGVRNGPPYPLSRQTVSEAYGKKKKRSISEVLQDRKARKEAEEREKREKEEAEKKARLAADKERVLREGTATELLQYKNELTAKEWQDSLNRIKWVNELTSLSKKELDKGWESVNSVMKKIGNLKDWTKTGVEFYKAINEAIKLSEEKQKKK